MGRAAATGALTLATLGGLGAASPATAAPSTASASCWGGYLDHGGYHRGQYTWCNSGKVWVRDMTYDGYAVQAVINGKRCTASGAGHEKTCYVSPRGAKWMYLYLVRGNHSTPAGRWLLPH
ncbi:hypothetical protein ACF082_34080 [Streptomyces lydicus]|uniref:hypothetical protein n=1 Tax=Streptomyces lydicus TaxID=47763 RepID=UPI0036F4BBDE